MSMKISYSTSLYRKAGKVCISLCLKDFIASKCVHGTLAQTFCWCQDASQTPVLEFSLTSVGVQPYISENPTYMFVLHHHIVPQETASDCNHCVTA